MFSPQQIAQLNAPLTRDHIKKNPKGFNYVEGWHAIAEANRIFGFDAWDRQTVDMRQLGEPELVGANWRVAYHCRVRIVVRLPGGGEVVRDGSGYGSGIVKDIRDAHESAIKEAETDAMKRALMTFGNPFGLALYDKEQANVCDAPQQPDESTLAFRDAVFLAFQSAQTVDALDQSWKENTPTMNTMGMTKDDPTYQEIVNEFKRCKRAFTDNQKEAA